MYAHSANKNGSRQSLVEHLHNVADLAAAYARPFAGEQMAWLAGLLHDVGKADPLWQRYLLESEAGTVARGSGPDHKFAGARLAIDAHQPQAALLIHAHHGGLQHRSRDFQPWFQANSALPGPPNAISAIRELIPEIDRLPVIAPPTWLQNSRDAEMFLRFVYSALVDADTIDTENHTLAGDVSRRGTFIGLEELWSRLERFVARANQGPDSTVHQVRREVLTASITAASHPPGVFRLTVPTGGGKTRSGMAFALRHAVENGLRRVIVAVPFTTITQQTASVYRQIFEDGYPDAGQVVLEHHSDAVELADPDDFTAQSVWTRLSAENWDAPIIVTTTVQLFESLFSNRRGRTRKLHNLSRSVVVLDEAQSLPAPLLAPILDALRHLSTQYGSTVVLCTATQPAFEVLPQFAAIPAREIVPGYETHFELLQRVQFEWRTDASHSWGEVAAWMHSEPSALAIVNTKRHAMELLDALADDDALHLSTNLCGAHRLEVLQEVRARLQTGRPCRVVSTQVVEAGVDLDFPTVFRALGPLDSIVQAAGRCNREGLLPHPGRVVVFQPADEAMPTGVYRAGADLATVVAESPDFNPGDPAAIRRYSSLLLSGAINPDREGIQALREDFDYPEVARRFRMIDDDSYDVVVRFPSSSDGQIQSLIDRLRARDPGVRIILRKLQPHTVSLRRRQTERFIRDGLITELLPGVGEWHGRYDSVRGLTADDPELVL